MRTREELTIARSGFGPDDDIAAILELCRTIEDAAELLRIALQPLGGLKQSLDDIENRLRWMEKGS